MGDMVPWRCAELASAPAAETVAAYLAQARRRWRLVGLLGLVLLAAFFCSLWAGTGRLSATAMTQALLGSSDARAERILWYIRLPRVLTAVLAGMGLSVAGAAIQSLLRNPLGSPFTLGLSQAAAFGAATAIVVFGAGSAQGSAVGAAVMSGALLTSGLAFVASLLAALALVLLARLRGASPETMILAGVALSTLFAAGVTGLQYIASDVELASIIFWTFGDVGRVGWSELALLAVVVLAALGYFIVRSWSLNALDSGDETAQSLGVNAARLRLEGMMVAALVTSTIVAFVGIIGFIGLIVPHMLRRVLGGDERFLLPAAALGGGLLLLVADLAARQILAPLIIPVGVLTSFLGAPLFLYLVVRGKSSW